MDTVSRARADASRWMSRPAVAGGLPRTIVEAVWPPFLVIFSVVAEYFRSGHRTEFAEICYGILVIARVTPVQVEAPARMKDDVRC
ncbi:MAG: hypothetical protein MEP57_07605 [Microvirga sp.]|nr:hypothetical protein [Microvirga sp.]